MYPDRLKFAGGFLQLLAGIRIYAITTGRDHLQNEISRADQCLLRSTGVGDAWPFHVVPPAMVFMMSIHLRLATCCQLHGAHKILIDRSRDRQRTQIERARAQDAGARKRSVWCRVQGVGVADRKNLAGHGGVRVQRLG